MKRKNIIAINIGSTSTKVAFYDGTQCVWTENCRHDPEQLHAEGEIFDQYEFRMANVMKALEKHGLAPDLIAGTSMGALVGGVYACGMNLRLMGRFCSSIDEKIGRASCRERV